MMRFCTLLLGCLLVVVMAGCEETTTRSSAAGDHHTLGDTGIHVGGTVESGASSAVR